jgi:streptogramin lyase
MLSHYRVFLAASLFSIVILAIVIGLAAPSSGSNLTFTEYPIPTPDSGPDVVAIGPDGALWFTENGAGKIGRLDPSGAIMEFSLPSAFAGPQGIVSGPDGALWYCDPRRGLIGRITIAGAITEYLVLNGGHSPAMIAQGPDGALWFTDSQGSGAIGRITTAGIITEYPTPTVASTPIAITAGPDGAMWFTEGWVGAGSKIGRITVAGVFTEFPAPGASGESLNAIATGPDGNIWFTASGINLNAVCRITPDGTVTSFPLPYSPSTLWGLTAGPGGKLWFADQTADLIGSMTLDGTFAEYPTPTPFSGPASIVADSSGNLWFGEGFANKIGKLTTRETPSCVRDAITLCLNGERFIVQTQWTDFQGNTGFGQVVAGVSSSDSGLMWFFGPDNWELLIKVLNGCGVNDHYWVFGAASTNVQYTMQVTDTQTGEVRTYTNPLGTSSPAITDAAAFASCP